MNSITGTADPLQTTSIQYKHTHMRERGREGEREGERERCTLTQASTTQYTHTDIVASTNLSTYVQYMYVCISIHVT